MNEIPLVSIVMPVYNAEQYLRDAIDSILLQTFIDFEFLIVDNGSTDRSLVIARECADVRIRIIEEPQRGIVAALNRGLREARGDYVARMDADDISFPHRLMRQVEYMSSHPGTVMVGCLARLIDANGQAKGIRRAPPANGKKLAASLLAVNEFVHGSIMMRRAIGLVIGGYRSQFVTSEDYDLCLRLAEIGDVANLPEILYGLRVHHESKTAVEGVKMVDDYTVLAQRTAFHRYIYGHDEFGYTIPTKVLRSERANVRSTQVLLDTVTLADWAIASMWRHQFRIGNVLLLKAILARPYDPHTWSIVRRCYLSTATIRVLVTMLYHVIRGGLAYLSTHIVDR